MDNPNQQRYLRRRKLFRTIFGIFSLSGIMFAFQACYGTPKDFGQDVQIKGKVTSGSTKAALAGIRVEVDQADQYTVTGSDGSYMMYCEQKREYRLIFSDQQTPRESRFNSRDTIIKTVSTDHEMTVLNVDIELQ